MHLKYFFELVLLAALWGASFMFLRIAAPEFGAIVLIEFRVFIASLFLLPIWFFREKASAKSAAADNWWHLLVVGLLNSAIPFVLFAYATLSITGGFASILNATVPIWGALVAWFCLRQPISRDGIIGLALGVIGVVVLVSGPLSGGLGSIDIGVYAALFAAFLYAVAANYTSTKLADVSALSISTLSQVWAAVVLLPLAIVYYPDHAISSRAWLSVLALGVFCTGFATTLYFRLIAHIGSTQAVTVTFLIPVFGTIWGALFIDEEVTLVMILGTTIILLGTALVTGVLAFKSKKNPHRI